MEGAGRGQGGERLEKGSSVSVFKDLLPPV